MFISSVPRKVDPPTSQASLYILQQQPAGYSYIVEQ